MKEWFDRSLWYQAKYAMSMNSIPELAFNISKIINSIFGFKELKRHFERTNLTQSQCDDENIDFPNCAAHPFNQQNHQN